MGLKKKLRQQRKIFHGKLASWLSPLFNRGVSRMRLKARIRLANRWGNKNPKKVTSVVMVMISLCIVTDIIFDLGKERKQLESTELSPKVKNIIELQRQTASINQRTDLKVQAIRAKTEKAIWILDSLQALPNKTHEDSTKIGILYNKIKLIYPTE